MRIGQRKALSSLEQSVENEPADPVLRYLTFLSQFVTPAEARAGCELLLPLDLEEGDPSFRWGDGKGLG